MSLPAAVRNVCFEACAPVSRRDSPVVAEILLKL
jgi:hypothetical protein